MTKTNPTNRNFEEFRPAFFVEHRMYARCCLGLLKDSEVVKMSEHFCWYIGISPFSMQQDLVVSSFRNRPRLPGCKYLLREIIGLVRLRLLPQYFLKSYLQEWTKLPELMVRARYRGCWFSSCIWQAWSWAICRFFQDERKYRPTISGKKRRTAMHFTRSYNLFVLAVISLLIRTKCIPLFSKWRAPLKPDSRFQNRWLRF